MRDILISGAGVAGPTLAYWLTRHGFRPTLVERAPHLRTGGYVVDFWGVGYDVAERMGLLDALRQVAYPIDEVRIVNRRGRRVTGFDARVFREASDGRFMSLQRSDLSRLVYERLSADVETIFGDTITGLTDDGRAVDVTFATSPPRRFDLVIGADGLHSVVRQIKFGDDGGLRRHLGYYVAAFTADAYPHRDEHAYVSYTVPGRQVARYALRDGRSAFFFIWANPDRFAVAPHDVPAQKQMLRDVFAGMAWETREMLAALDAADDLYVDPVAQIRMRRWFAGRVALVGDAAYCPSLLAGQGSGFAMAGAYLLAHALAHHSTHGAAFAEYQRRFKPFMDDKQRSAERFGSWFAPRTWLQAWMRNRMTGLMNTPLVGRMIVRRSFMDVLQLPD
ncbi:MAG TPA: FAD-binding domain [Gemmatimonadaceae bacterium]|nr:FAD-binding domain [Gemmatimonadaceae bacterium]